MDLRHLLQGLVYAAALAAATRPLSPTVSLPFAMENSSQLVEYQILHHPLPVYFLAEPSGANHSSKIFPVPTCHGFVLEDATIDALQDAFRNGTLTTVDLVLCYLQRIQQTDEYLRAVLQLNPDFLKIAKALDAERVAGRVRGPLHGIPFLVKDNIATKDKMETTAGSYALLGSIVPRDAHVVHRLRSEGALLPGHSALSEWADMRSNNYSEGYSARGGQCRSAYNLTVNPGGSSSGSGVAVGANLVTFAIGTETDGSVVNPAQRNALVGIKPTVGLTSRAGVIPESLHQDTVGCLARTVRDATYCLDGIYGVDQRDNYTLAQLNNVHVPSRDKGYASFLTNKDSLKDATFGIPWLSFWQWADPDMQAQLVHLVRQIEDAGATIINGTELPNWQRIVSPDGWNWDYGSARGYPNESEYTYIKVDFYNDVKAYLAELTNTPVRSLEHIVQYNLDNAGSEGGVPDLHPAFPSGQDGFLASLATKGTRDETYWQALQFCQRATREEGIDAALAHHTDTGARVWLSALLAPTDVAQAPQIAAQAGYPVVTLPAGVHKVSGMPFGLALMGTAWSEGELVRWASAIEDAMRSQGRERPRPKWLGYRMRNLPVDNA
ncbi:amidase signature domain-containing protein [Daedaleopsis nitida]|nr:amidase signature domain-containing protein [Daedaleopsis nitida]